MRLTFVNFRKGVAPFNYRGKHRKVKPVELPALRERYLEYQREEENMLILRHPYLTVEQSHGHMVGVKPKRLISELYNEGKIKKFNKVLTWAEQLSHLRVKDAWE